MTGYLKMWLIPLLLVIIMAGCEDRVGISSLPVIITPTVSSTNPINAATGVALNQKITATFSVAMDASTITASTFTLNLGTIPIPGFVSYTDTTATFAPSNNLTPDTTYTVTITTGAKDLEGNTLTDDYIWSFTTDVTYTVTLSSNPSEGGTIAGGGAFNSGDSVTVTATANAGYAFANWTENGAAVSTDTSYAFTIFENRTLVANFTFVQIPYTPIPYTVTLSSNPTAGGTTSGGGAFNSDSSVTVTATANVGYTFTNWTESGTAVSTDTSYTFTLIGNRTLVANFTAIQYTVTLSSNPSAGGTTSGGGTFSSGASVTVTAIANAIYF